MANEFIARKGLIALDDSTISGSLTVEKSGSTVFEVVGSTGQLFSIEDSMQGSLFAVSDISGLPILEVFSDDKIVAGAYGQNAFVINGSKIGIGTASPEAGHTTGAGLTILNAGTIGSTNNFTKARISSSLLIKESDSNFLVMDSNEISNYGSDLYLGAISNNTGRGNIQFRAGVGSLSTRMFISSSGKVGIGTSSPTELLHVKSGDIKLETGDLHIIDSHPTIFLSDTNHNPDFSLNVNSGQFKITDTSESLTRVIVNEIGNVGIGGGFNPTDRLHVSGTLRLKSHLDQGDFANIVGTRGSSLIKDVIASQTYEDQPFINTETINAFAGADKWAHSITASNVYSSWRPHTTNHASGPLTGILQPSSSEELTYDRLEEMFRVGGSTFQPYFSESGNFGNDLDEIVIEIDHNNLPIKYHAMVGIQFTHPNWRARRVKIEAYTASVAGGISGWVTGIDVQDQPEGTIGTYINASGGGIRRTRFTLGRPFNSGGLNHGPYVRISKLFAYDYKGVSSGVDDPTKRGTYYLEKYDDTTHYGDIYPATGGLELGKADAKYSTIYADNLIGTASFALNAESTGFPFTGSAGIQGDLHINSSENTLLLLESTDGLAHIAFKDDTTTDTNRVRIGAAGNELQFIANGSEVGRFDNNGRLGINTNNPAGRLHVFESSSGTSTATGIVIEQTGSGDSLLQFLLSNQRRFVMGIDNSDDNKFKISKTFDLDTSASFTIDGNQAGPSSNIGINTVNPLRALHVSGSGSDTGILLELPHNDAVIESRTNTAGSYFRANSKGSANYYGLELNNNTTAKWFLGSYGDSDFHITEGAKSGDDQRITIKNSTGKVGIGTKNPQESLTTTGNLLVTASSARKIEVSVADFNSEAKIVLDALRSGSNSQGDPLGMGSSALYKSGAFTYFDTDEDLYIRPNNKTGFRVGGGGDIHFVSSSKDSSDNATIGTTYLFGDASKQKVGIGTTTPTSPLTVSGSADVTGSVAVTGSIVVTGSINATSVTTNNLTVSESITADTITLLGLTLIDSQTVISSGSNIFGDDASSDTHQFLGNITASGDISASGTITLDKILNFGNTDGEIRTTHPNGSGHIYINPDGNLYLGENRTDNILIGREDNPNTSTKIFDGSATEAIRVTHKSTKFGTHVTASSNISASGIIHGTSFKIGTATVLQGETNVTLGSSGATGTISLTTHGGTPLKINDSDDVEITGHISASNTMTLGSSSLSGSIFEVIGSSGQLFSIEDGLSGSLFAVSDISGLPILEVFSDDRVIAGAYNQNDFVISGSRVGIGTNTPNAKLDVIGNISSSGTGSMPYLMLGGATSLTEGSTRLEVNGQINVNGTDGGGSTGTVRSFRGKFNKINNRASGNDIIEFTTGNNVSILGPVTASNNISASGEIRGQKLIADFDGSTGGLRFTDPDDGNTDDNRITLSSAKNMQFKADGVFQFSNGHVQVLKGNQLTLSDGENQSKFKIQNISANTGSGDENNITLAIKNESGTSLLTISGSGNTNLAGNLEVYTSSVVMGEYAIQSLTTSGPKINFGKTNDLDSYMSIGAFNSTNNIDSKGRDFKLYSTSVSKGLIFSASTGDIGIGTDEPTERLHVHGNNILLSGSNTHEYKAFPTSNTYSAGIRFKDDELAYVWGGGIKAYFNSSHGLSFGDRDPSNGGANRLVEDPLIGKTASSEPTGSFHIKTANTTRLLISSSGNVGIGTNSPEHALHVHRDNANGELKVERNSGTAIFTQAQASLGRFGTTTDDDLQLITHDGARMTIRNNGKVGIGTTTPAQLLEVNGGNIEVNGGSLQISHSSAGQIGGQFEKPNQDLLTFRFDSKRLRFWAGGTERLTILSSSGNVGIGTSAPSEKLEVKGNISASGMLFASLSLDSSNFKTVMYDTSSGKFFFTGSYGGGGGGGSDNLGNHIATQDLDMAGNSISASLHITASGNISASEQFIGANFGLDSTDKLQFSEGTLQFRLNDTSRITHTSTIFRPTSDEGVSLGRSAEKWKELVVNHVTASGNISASGDLEAAGKLTISGTLEALDGGFIVTGSTSTILEVVGDISASGNLFADLTNANGSHNNTVMYNTTTGRLYYTGSYGGGGTTIPDGTYSSSLQTLGNITSSGEISASSAVVGNIEYDTNALVKSTSDLTYVSESQIFRGDIVKFGNDSTVAGNLYYWSSTSQWLLASDSTVGARGGMLAIALGTNSDTNGMLVRGIATLANTVTIGSQVYIGSSDGSVTSTAPSTPNKTLRSLGHAIEDNTIYFNPSPDFIITK